jgi:hypothetical protein
MLLLKDFPAFYGTWRFIAVFMGGELPLGSAIAEVTFLGSVEAASATTPTETLTGPYVWKCKDWFHECHCAALAAKTGKCNIRAHQDNKHSLQSNESKTFSS